MRQSLPFLIGQVVPDLGHSQKTDRKRLQLAHNSSVKPTCALEKQERKAVPSKLLVQLREFVPIGVRS